MKFSLKKKLINATFIPTSISYFLFHDACNPNYQWPTCHLVVTSTTRFIFIPYGINFDWRVFLIDAPNNYFTLIDPINRKQSELEDDLENHIKALFALTCLVTYCNGITDLDKQKKIGDGIGI